MAAQTDTAVDRVERVLRTRPGLPLGRAALSAMLEYIDEVLAAGQTPVVVFDLDSTLFHTNQRNFQILTEFVAHFGHDRPALLEAYDRLSREGTGWNIAEDVEARGVDDQALLSALRRYWRERFFTNDYLRHDLPVEGSPEFVRACHDRGAFCYYLTGRDVPNMRAGTEESLRRHGFPMDRRAHLHLKARFEDDDYLFKQGVVEELRCMGRVVGVFENEPANVNLFHREFPDAIVVFLETVHSPGAPPVLPGIYRVKNFQLEAAAEEA
jgi:hypothetical protein